MIIGAATEHLTAGAFEPGAGVCGGAAAPSPFCPVLIEYIILEITSEPSNYIRNTTSSTFGELEIFISERHGHAPDPVPASVVPG
jgi:hypothetical protein